MFVSALVLQLKSMQFGNDRKTSPNPGPGIRDRGLKKTGSPPSTQYATNLSARWGWLQCDMDVAFFRTGAIACLAADAILRMGNGHHLVAHVIAVFIF